MENRCSRKLPIQGKKRKSTMSKESEKRKRWRCLSWSSRVDITGWQERVSGQSTALRRYGATALGGVQVAPAGHSNRPSPQSAAHTVQQLHLGRRNTLGFLGVVPVIKFSGDTWQPRFAAYCWATVVCYGTQGARPLYLSGTQFSFNNIDTHWQ